MKLFSDFPIRFRIFRLFGRCLKVKIASLSAVLDALKITLRAARCVWYLQDTFDCLPRRALNVISTKKEYPQRAQVEVYKSQTGNLFTYTCVCLTYMHAHSDTRANNVTSGN